MFRIRDLFKLIRVINLVFIMLSQYLFRYCIELPLLQLEGLEPRLGHVEFFFLVLSTIFIAAAGYIINDYFDVKIDQVNKPQRITIGRTISRRKAMFIHLVFNFLGIFIAGILAYKAGNMFLMLLHAVTAMVLWFYSTTLKRQFLTGNLAVSMLTALVILIVPAYDIGWVWMLKGGEEQLLRIFSYSALYAFFAFIVSMVREIVKDMEDVKGDADLLCETVPVVMGIKKAKYFTYFFQLILMVLLVWVIFIEVGDRQWMLVFYGIFFLLIPTLYLFYRIYLADKIKELRNISSIIKLIMLAGIVSMALIYYVDAPQNYF